jgi:hypothetical protein
LFDTAFCGSEFSDAEIAHLDDCKHCLGAFRLFARQFNRQREQSAATGRRLANRLEERF